MVDVATFARSGANSSVQTDTTSSATNNTTDNSNYAYHMELQPPVLNLWSEDIKFYSATIRCGAPRR